eukprot:TRINITY_DN18733_c0_g2_i1.p1 TRINITY_DN18733_c0_g2~~TRINITY_DN18733_c0_g2_i1.p1  ORF type:complete len:675 (+),score=118.50 TRINITY_DN18733_c0_g2_i1:1906-3930(+)
MQFVWKVSSFNRPWGVIVDFDGNVVISDTNNHSIKKILDNGNVYCVAGSKEGGFEDGENGKFRSPMGLAIDTEGNIIVADRDNHAIRKIHHNGKVSTIAGGKGYGYQDGPASVAKFQLPWGVAFDSVGDLLVTDSGNHLIRKITPGGVVSTLAGSGIQGFRDGPGKEAQFNNPFGITVDKNSIIYVSDAFNHSIRRITPTGEVSTLSSGFSFPHGITVDDSGVILVADRGKNVIKSLSVDGAITEFRRDNTLFREISCPFGLIVDQQANLVITFGNSCCKISQNLILLTGSKRVPNQDSQFTNLFSKLLASGKYSDFSINLNGNTIPLHKGILALKCPKLLDMTYMDYEKNELDIILQFVYTNQVPNLFEPTKILRLIEKSKLLELNSFTYLCQKQLLAVLAELSIVAQKKDTPNILTFMTDCSAFLDMAQSLKLTDEARWIRYTMFKIASGHPQVSEQYQNLIIESSQNLPQLPPQLPPQPDPLPLSEFLRSLYERMPYPDFNICVEDKKIPVHRYILDTKWPYFSTILVKGTPAGSQSSTDLTCCYHKLQMPLDVFNSLIRFLYDGNLQRLGIRDCGWILYSGDYYLLEDVPSLYNFCREKVNSPITIDTWNETFQLAMEIGNDNLKEKLLSVESLLYIPSSFLATACKKLFEENLLLKTKLNQSSNPNKQQ